MVALKVTQSGNIAAAMLAHEAAILDGLDHPGVIQLQDIGEDQGLTYLALNHVTGETLSARLKRSGAFPLSECLSIGIQMCEILDYLHGTGLRTAPNRIIHGDIKPANIMVDMDGHVTLLDFGIARSSDTGSSLVEGYGTPGYMAPEQWSDGTVDRRTDLFMLGVVLFEMATGTRLFRTPDLPTLEHTDIGDSSWCPINHLPGTYKAELMPFIDILKECVADVHWRPPTAGHLADSMRTLQSQIEAPGSMVNWTQSVSAA